MEKRYYIAYGSNLNIRQMRMRCPGARIIGTSVIEGYRLLFKGSRTGSYLTIEPQEGASVPVAAWAVTEEDEAALDRYEGFPAFYYKKEMELPLKGIRTGKVRLRKVFVYIMHEDRPLGVPSGFYMETCRQGYQSFGFDEAFLERAYADSREKFPGGWKTGGRLLHGDQPEERLHGQLHRAGIRWEIFLAPEQQGQPLPRIRRPDVPQQGGGACPTAGEYGLRRKQR